MGLLGLFGLRGGFTAFPGGGDSEVEATGGMISTYEDSGTNYKTHVFNSPGTFTVTAGGEVELMVVGGGGGGSGGFPGFGPGQGGGGGGMAVATQYTVSSSPGSYPITIGEPGIAGLRGPGSPPYNHLAGISGGDSVFTNPSAPLTVTGKGGGGAGGGENTGSGPLAPFGSGRPGGSGGGGGWLQGGSAPQVAGGTASQPTQNPGISNLTNYGNAGGAGLNDTSGAGGTGGGGGGAGNTYPNVTGGAAQPNAFSTGSAIAYAGGGLAGQPNPNVDGVQGSGAGGQGWGNVDCPSPSGGQEDGFGTERGGYGGSGTVVVRYSIGSSAGTAKASGGLISFYNSKVIHTFTSPGVFTTNAGFNETCEYVIIAGGGAGGSGGGMSGGGGAGVLKTATTPINTPTSTPHAVSVGNGGGCATTKGYYTSTNTGPNMWSASGIPSSVAFPAGTITSAGGAQGSAGSPIYVGSSNGFDWGTGGGGSGGAGGVVGTGGNGSGDPFPGTIGTTPANGWGCNGGPGASAPGDKFCGGGGGGAGGDGEAGQTGTPRGGCGGKGIQLPSTFRDPASSVGAPGPTTGDTNGDSSGKFWVCGGGGGAQYNGTQTVTGGTGNDPTVGPYSGGGNASGGAGAGGPAPTAPAAQSGWANTGGGGGAAGGFFDGTGGASIADAGNGGSGVVLIAYPE